MPYFSTDVLYNALYVAKIRMEGSSSLTSFLKEQLHVHDLKVLDRVLLVTLQRYLLRTVVFCSHFLLAMNHTLIYVHGRQMRS